MNADTPNRHIFSWKAVKEQFSDESFFWSCIISLVILATSLALNKYSGVYATHAASNAVSDIILSNIPVYDVEWIFIYGPLILCIFAACLLIISPHKIPFTLKTVSLFIIIRALFVMMTHLGPFPTQAYVDPTNILASFTTGNDLFFSGHTGLPFVLALVFWHDLRLRVIFIATAIFFGCVVLMGHFHYSIDVASAFFITYTIYKIAERWFHKDLVYFRKA